MISAMKKILLLGLAIGMTIGGFSQSKVAKLNFVQNTAEQRADFNFNKQSNEVTPNAVNLKSGNAVLLERAEMGKSGNAYSVLTSYQRCLAYDEVSGAYLGTFRADKASYPGALESGTVMGHTSADGGDSWNHVVVLNPAGDEHALRYPSGVLYNADGSSSADDLYIIATGPAHTGGTWDYTFHGVSDMNGANLSDYYYTWESENDWARSSMTVVPEAVYNFGQDYTTVGEAGADQTMKHYVGISDDPANGFEWEYNSVTPDWLVDAADGTAVALYTNWAAWSKDGSIGYMWMIGATNDSEAYGGYQPQVYYTVDAGDSWDEIELDMEDHPTLVEFLPPWEDVNGNPGTVKPTMGISQGGTRAFPGVVDYQGRLHLFAPTFGSSKESVTDPESGYWTVGEISGGHIFDFVIDADGLQDIILVDSVMSEKAADNAFGDVTWDHRLQVSKSVDEKVVFAVWADDDNTDDGTLKNPNIYAWGYNTETGVQSDAVNFTQDDLYAGFYFYHYVAELTPMIDGFYNIPVSTSITPTEFGGNDATAPITHNFVGGIGFDESTFIGIEDHLNIASSQVTVSQNQPNPFTGTTSINITSNSIASVSIEVSNMIGQTVYRMNAGIINGSKKVNLHAADLKSGVYFYTVRIANESVTKKMIIE